MHEVPEFGPLLYHLNIEISEIKEGRNEPGYVLHSGKVVKMEYLYKRLTSMDAIRWCLDKNATDLLKLIHAGGPTLRRPFEEYLRLKFPPKDETPGEEKEAHVVPDWVRPLKIFRDPRIPATQNPYFVVNIENMQLVPDMQADVVLFEATGERGAAIADYAEIVTQTYAPKEPPGISEIQVAGVPLKSFNTYVRPDWMDFPREEKLPDECPEEVEKLMRHLFPIKEEREFVWHWIYMSIFRRAMTVLVLNGIPGVGKNRFKAILDRLHGRGNIANGRRSAFGTFNSQLFDTTFIFFDETKLNKEAIENMKAWLNPTGSIERKGVDATKETRLYMSICVASNYPREVALNFRDRKFVPMTLNQTRLEKTMTQEEIKRLSQEFEYDERAEYPPNPRKVAQLARWIEKNCYREKWENCEYQGPAFYGVCQAALSRNSKNMVRDLRNLAIGGVGATFKKLYKTTLPRMTKSLEHPGFKPETGPYLWSEIEPVLLGKNSDRFDTKLPDSLTSRDVLEEYRDLDGSPVFKVTNAKSDDRYGDFFVEVLKPEIADEDLL